MTVIFDLDGTLLNTIGDLGEACNFALKRLNFPTHTPEQYKHLVGNGVRKLIERALPEGYKTDETIEQVLSLFKQYYDKHCCDNTFPYDGISQLVDDLQSRDFNVAVASNKYQSAAERIVNHYFPTIRYVYGQRDGVPIKPSPFVVEEIMTDLKIHDKSEILYIGDSGVDWHTAKNAGVKATIVSWGFCSRQELKEKGIENIVDTIDELRQIIFE
ncbi:MAG: HAD family hydrolase [Paludibacteraceae bacterium]|nr:HAD family hydrolase [Paludibacteraceae bacterium]